MEQRGRQLHSRPRTPTITARETKTQFPERGARVRERPDGCGRRRSVGRVLSRGHGCRCAREAVAHPLSAPGP